MRVIVVGLGVQGHKRRRFAGSDFVSSVDVRNPDADFRDLREVSLDAFDAALLCVPDAAKIGLLDYLVEHGKHALIEKPLVADDEAVLARLQQDARAKGVVLYVAYNHRFEPHFVRMRDLVKSGALGRIYRCRMFYGNGTARLVRNSDWRDHGAGVLDDLGSHVLDTARFWFGDVGDAFSILLLEPSPAHAARVFWDRTFGWQVGRDSPFSIWGWGQYHAAGIPDLGPFQQLAIALLLAGAIACYFVPRRKTPLQLAALTAAVLIGFELTLTHWFYLYIPWFFPFVAFVVLAARRRRAETVPAHDDAERELVATG
jgi:predicted dehydrogenase